MEQGFGFLLLLMVHLVGMNAVGGLERLSATEAPGAEPPRRGRFRLYRTGVRIATLGAGVVLAAWLWRIHA